MKITVYTISTCPFSQQEKDYLKANNLPYEEKNLEMNREWLAEMLAISNNFAGTPVTRIEDDQGQIRILKGFTKEEFDEVLGLKPREEAKPVSEMNNQVTPPPVANQSVSNQPSPSDQAPSPTQSTSSAQPTTPNQQTQPPPNLPEDQQPTTDQSFTSDFNPPVPPPPPAVPFSQSQAAPQEPSFPAGQDIGQANQADNNPTPAPPVEDLSAQNPTNPFDINPVGQPSNPIDQSEQGVVNNQPNQTPSNLPNIPDFPGE